MILSGICRKICALGTAALVVLAFVALCWPTTGFAKDGGPAGLERGRTAYAAGRFAEAMTHLRPLADKGHAGAAVLVGQMLVHGSHGKRDVKAGRRYLEQAAAGSSIPAMVTLGSLLVTGQVLPYEPENGVRLLSKAARAGDPEAQHMLGFAKLYIVQPRNDAARREGLAWLKKSARQHFLPAFLSLAEYHDGETVRRLNGSFPADPDATFVEALQWAMIGVYAKAPGAVGMYERLQARTRHDEALRTRAASRARDWLRKHPKPEGR